MYNKEIINECEIRNFLKTLTVEDIANSTYLFGIDFDKATIEDILECIIVLYNNVQTLHDIIRKDFKEDGVLLPQSPETQAVIIADYECKGSVLLKLLNNSSIKDAISKKLKEKDNTHKSSK